MPFYKKDPTSGELLVALEVHGGHYKLSPKDTKAKADGWAWYATEAEGLAATKANAPAVPETVEVLKAENAALKAEVVTLKATAAAIGKVQVNEQLA
jgi:hypothetical protein